MEVIIMRKMEMNISLQTLLHSDFKRVKYTVFMLVSKNGT